MTYTDITRDQFRQLKDLEGDAPIYMINLLKFKDVVDEEGGISGAQQYRKYLKATGPFIEKSKGKVTFNAKPLVTLIGPIEGEWDKMLIVEYPTKGDFINMIMDPDYPSEMRKKALVDSRLILCR